MALANVFRSPRVSALAVMSVVLVATVGVSPPAMADKQDNAPAILRLKKRAADTAQSHDSSHAIVGSATTETGLVGDRVVSPFLLPDSSAAMQAAADKYAGIVAKGGWPKVPGGKLKKGSTGNAVAALNKRLYIEGYLRVEATEGEYAQTFTSATEEALMQFQRNMGLSVTGKIDGPTLGQLNVPAERRLATIKANIPRIAEYSKDLGDRYVVVNVPAMQIETVSNGKVYSRHNAIVGRPSRPTPVVMTPLATVRFNPYWNAPPSIVERDIVPRMLSSRPSKVMASMNMKVFDGVGGPEINPDRINWRRAVVDKYHFRQEPGGDNAMATAKIEFNSPFGIYLHDTPEPQLFKSGMRFYSSGCVRVEKVATLIDWILQGQDGIDRSKIADLADTKERLDVKIATAPQLRVAYLTAWPTRSGVVAFRPDIYEMDGSGFVVGQPMPVGDRGQRFVLKPIPRSAVAVEEDEATGFASLFRNARMSDGDNPFNRPSARSRSNDTETVSTAGTAKKQAKKKSSSSSKNRKVFFGRKDTAPAIFRDNIARGDTPSKKTTKKKLTAKSKAKKADTAKKLAGKSCKPDKNGKLPKGCDTPPAKKPVAKPEQTSASAN